MEAKERAKLFHHCLEVIVPGGNWNVKLLGMCQQGMSQIQGSGGGSKVVVARYSGGGSKVVLAKYSGGILYK